MNSDQLEGYLKEVQTWNMVQLLEGRAGWKQESAAWHVVDREIRRRDERGTRWIARIALFVSFASLIVAVLKP